VAVINERKIADILNALEKLKYGSLIITVHDDEITQIETSEKKRYQLQGKKEK
jgi:hypothetical protein